MSCSEQHFEELAALVTREHGKTLAEARAEVNRGIEMVEFACGIPSLLMGDVLPNIATNVDAEAIRHPVGVCVGITPYNFPFMVPLWMFPMAMTCGNTFVLKPSEKVPLSSVRLGELLTEAGLPEGVFNIVHGDRECVDALLDHPKVAAISFVGSTTIAKYIYERGTASGEAGAVGRRGEESFDHHAGCRLGSDGEAIGRECVWLRWPAVHGRERGGDGRQGG